MNAANRDQRKASVAERFGGRCQRCGYARSLRALHFHHLDRTEKRDWSNGRGHASLDEVEAHPERFLYLCANCHIEEHERLDAESATMHTCLHCGTSFRSAPHRPKSGRGRYCSRQCQHAQRADIAPTTAYARVLSRSKRAGDHLLWQGYMTRGTPVVGVTLPDGRHTPRSARQVVWEHEHGIPAPKRISVSCAHLNCLSHLIA